MTELFKEAVEIYAYFPYSDSMKTQTIEQESTVHSLNGKFKLGARPPRRLSAAARKQLDEMVPSVKAREMAARFDRSQVIRVIE
ncbi:MAG TPA: hypothetical protein HPP97_00785 [Desulfuromonadales bacterium]|nr:hypothetical protein [Desulfuromonadales bacterium]